MNYSKGLIFICLIIAWSCGKPESAETKAPENNSAGFVSVNGVQKVTLGYSYVADMESIGLGAGWYLFEKEQKESSLEYEQALVYLREREDKFGIYPFTIFVTNVPECEDIYLDEILRADDGSLSFRQQTHDQKAEINYSVSVDAFSYFKDEEDGRLDVDITITSDYSDTSVRIVYSGPALNDGREYMMD